MTSHFSTFSKVLLLICVFGAVVSFSNQFLRSASLDLSEDKLYSLTQGTKSILDELDEPIKLSFFFSDSTTSGMSQLRNYAMQVESLLRQYEELGKGNITLEIIDPEPFSEQEDRAASLGLSAPVSGPAQDSIYFGLAGENNSGDAFIIGFFDPSKSAFLEYDISKLIYQLSQPDPVKLTLVSNLPLGGEQNPMTGQFSPPSALLQQLEQLFDVTLLQNADEALPQDTHVLVLAHPQGLNESLLYSIDQYLMRGGKALVFYDPHFESDNMAMMGAQGANASQFDLLNHYGIEINNDNIVLDPATALELRGSDGAIFPHLGYLGLGSQNINSLDVTSSGLETLNGASFGMINLRENSALSMNSLIESSSKSELVSVNEYAGMDNIAELDRLINGNGQQRVLASRISGTVESFFNKENELAKADHISQSGSLNMVLVADADLLMDRFWVQQSNFFGQTVFSPFADNGTFIINIVENFGGSEYLIGLRSRGSFERPFERVDQIALEAQEKFNEQEALLQAQLEDTEAQLSQLQNQDTANMVISDEQQLAIDNFVAKRIEIRRALREVQFQLDKDINALGTQLKVLNIVVVPILFAVLLYLMARLLLRRKP